MFLGSIPDKVSFFLANAIKRIDFVRAVVPCSGNFVIEQILRSKERDFPIHGYDVNVYSCAVGSYFSSLDFPLQIVKDEFRFLEPFQDGLDKAAKAAFLSELAKFSKLKHEHDRREYSRLVQRHEKVIELFKARMVKVKELLVNYTFHPEDMVHCFDWLGHDDLVIFHPPFWSGGYERMYKFVNEVVSWERPHYTDISGNNRFELVKRFVGSGCKLFVIMDGYRDKLLDYGLLPVYIYEKNLHNQFVVYSNIGDDTKASRYVFKEQTPRFKLFDDAHEITAADKIGIVPVSSLIGNHYRNMWVKKVTMTTGGCCFLLTLNDMVFGLLQINAGWMKMNNPGITLFSDPAIPSARYKRLSKLVIMILLTKEFKKIIDDYFVYDHEIVYTRVVTNNQISMKYRGLFKLKSKKKVDGEENYDYVLTYYAKLGQFKLKNVIKEWLQKYELPARRNNAS